MGDRYNYREKAQGGHRINGGQTFKISIAIPGMAQEVEKALTNRLGEVADNVLTLTADHGKECANHQVMTEKLGATVYFAHPYHSWERGLNEHTNGLVRHFLRVND